MEHNPQEANRFSTSQNFIAFYETPTVHYCIQKCPQVRGFLCEYFLTRYIFTMRSC